MHEGSFTEAIVNSILDDLKKQPDRPPRRARVAVGDIYHLVPEAVLMHFEAMAKGTPLEQTVLELVPEKLEVSCPACGKTGPSEDHHMLMCTFCSSLDVKAVKGDKIYILEIER